MRIDGILCAAVESSLPTGIRLEILGLQHVLGEVGPVFPNRHRTRMGA